VRIQSSAYEFTKAKSVINIYRGRGKRSLIIKEYSRQSEIYAGSRREFTEQSGNRGNDQRTEWGVRFSSNPQPFVLLHELPRPIQRHSKCDFSRPPEMRSGERAAEVVQVKTVEQIVYAELKRQGIGAVAEKLDAPGNV
jgi:hypothetical protein